MLTYHRKLVYLSFISTDLPIWSTIETTAFLYQKDREKFHLLLSPQNLSDAKDANTQNNSKAHKNKESIWLELSASRVVMTMQTRGQLSYRHFWEEGLSGVSRYLLSGESPEQTSSFRLRNFTRSLRLEGSPLPTKLRIEYELRTQKLQLGSYVLHLNIHH
jgi:hypothetical protein